MKLDIKIVDYRLWSQNRKLWIYYKLQLYYSMPIACDEGQDRECWATGHASNIATHSPLLAQCCACDNLYLLGRLINPVKYHTLTLPASQPENQKISCTPLPSASDFGTVTGRSSGQSGHDRAINLRQFRKEICPPAKPWSYWSKC